LKKKGDTIRKITAGVKPEDERIKDRVTSLILRMVHEDLDIKNIEELITVHENVLSPADVKAQDLVSLAQTSKQAGIETKMLVETYKAHRQSGLSFENLRDILAYKKEIESCGFTLANLSQISTIAQKNDRDPRRALDAVLGYDSLETIKSEFQKTRNTLDSLNKECEAIAVRKKALEEGYQHLQAVIEMCDELMEKYKFNIPSIRTIYRTAKKLGNPLDFIEALQSFDSLQEIRRDVEHQRNENAQLVVEKTELAQSVKSLRAMEVTIKDSIRDVLQSAG